MPEYELTADQQLRAEAMRIAERIGNARGFETDIVTMAEPIYEFLASQPDVQGETPPSGGSRSDPVEDLRKIADSWLNGARKAFDDVMKEWNTTY